MEKIFYLVYQEWRYLSTFVAYLTAEDEAKAALKAANFKRNKKLENLRLLDAEQFAREFANCQYYRCYFLDQFDRDCYCLILATTEGEATLKFRDHWPDKEISYIVPDGRRKIFWANSYEEPEEIPLPEDESKEMGLAIATC